MAQHTELPIYKDAYTLLDLIVEITKHIPRDFKRLIGEKMREECLEITILIFRANIHRDKVPHLTDLLERQQVLELILRLARDKRLIATSQYAKAAKLTQSIGRQANGWKKAAALQGWAIGVGGIVSRRGSRMRWRNAVPVGHAPGDKPSAGETILRCTVIENKEALLALIPVGTRVKIRPHQSAPGRRGLTGRTGTVTKGHFDGWYVLLDRMPRERTQKEVLVLQSVGLDVEVGEK